jgi:PAS domain S-box-containing protein
MTKTGDMRKTKAQLVEELQDLRRQVTRLQKQVEEHKEMLETPTQDQLLLGALMDSVSDYVYFKDRECRFIRTTRAHARTFGLSDPAEVVGKTDFDFFTEDHARPAYEDEQRIVQTGEPLLDVEERETWPDRPDTWVSTSKMPLRDAAGNIVGTFGISRDITERRHVGEVLKRRARQLQMVAEVSREAIAILDVRQLLDRVVNLVSDGFGFYHTGIFLLDDAGQYVVLRTASSEGGQRMLERGHSLLVGQTGVVGHAAATNEPRIAFDVGEDAVLFDNPDLPATRSEMALPLSVRGGVIGVLDVQSTEPSAFVEEDIAVLRILADQLAIAIENARLIERSGAQLRELSLMHGEYSASAWADLASPERSQVYVYDRVDVRPVEESPSQALDKALESGKVVTHAGSEADEAVLAMPLKVRGRTIGAIGVQEIGDGREWSPQEMALVEAVSDQVAVALDSARLFAEARIRAEELVVLNELARHLTGTPSVNEALRRAHEAVSHLLRSSSFYVGLYDAERDAIDFVYDTSEAEEDLQIATVSADEGLAGYIVRNRKSVLIKENLDERLEELGITSVGADALSWLGVPLLIGDQVLGMMAVQSYDTAGAFGEHDLDLLTAIASQTAIAIQSVRLLEQTQRRAQRERQIYEITTRLRRSPDMATILQTAVDELGQVLRTDRAVVRLAVRPREAQESAERVKPKGTGILGELPETR